MITMRSKFRRRSSDNDGTQTPRDYIHVDYAIWQKQRAKVDKLWQLLPLKFLCLILAMTTSGMIVSMQLEQQKHTIEIAHIWNEAARMCGGGGGGGGGGGVVYSMDTIPVSTGTIALTGSTSGTATIPVETNAATVNATDSVMVIGGEQWDSHGVEELK